MAARPAPCRVSVRGMSPAPDYLDHLARESVRFRAVLAGAADDARVPSCPDWDAVDLHWHLAEVQWFWGEVVRRGIRETAEAEKLERERPADRAAVEAAYDEASRGLGDVLATNPPETEVWTWAPEQTVGFIRRRQAHEALIHRVDAELTTGDRTPLDPALSSDGVDEVLRVMCADPGWGTFTPALEQTVRFVATDTGASWVVTLGRFSGTDPDDGSESVDEGDLRAAPTDDGAATAATVRGAAADLDCWLWNREPLGELELTGDAAVLAALERVKASDDD
jgi:uncharacterized protein (TIGR03083 family)